MKTVSKIDTFDVIEPTKWDSRFMSLAFAIAAWSKDPSSCIGAVAISSDHRVLATGYNGFPVGIDDSEERYSDRETKLKYIVHAEMNMIYNACNHGVSLAESTVYVWGLPICNECAKGVIQTGVKRVVIPYSRLVVSERWHQSFLLAGDMLREGGVRVDILAGH